MGKPLQLNQASCYENKKPALLIKRVYDTTTWTFLQEVLRLSYETVRVCMCVCVCSSRTPGTPGSILIKHDIFDLRKKKKKIVKVKIDWEQMNLQKL